MNSDLLLLINGWAGHWPLLDAAGVFCAVWLVYIVFFIALACVAILASRREWKPLAYAGLSLVVTLMTLKLMELLNVDHRPFMDHALTQLVSHASGQSFPSDHTTASAAVALAVLVFTRFKKTGVVLLCLACMIGISRIYVGVHYPADIIGGFVTAAIGSGLTYGAFRVVESRSFSKRL
jgi:undecaprenyl-diphosphatase